MSSCIASDALSPENSTLRDPTKVTPGFEKTYRELVMQSRGLQQNTTNDAAATPKLPDVKLLGCLVGTRGEGTATFLIDDKHTLTLRNGSTATFWSTGQLITLQLERITNQEVHLLLLPFNQKLVLH